MPRFPSENRDSPRGHARFAVGVFSILFVLFSLAGYGVFRRLESNERTQVENTLSRIADVQSAAVSSWMRERLNDAEVFGGGSFLGESMDAWLQRGAPDDEVGREMREQVTAIKTSYGYLEVAILDTSGQALISASSGLSLGPVAMQTVHDAIAGNSTAFSSIHAMHDNNYASQVVDIATPLLHIRNRSKHAASVLYMKANADLPLDPFVHSLPLQNTATDVLLARISNGKVVTMSTSDNAQHFQSLDVLPVTPQQLMATARKSAGQFFLKDALGREADAVARTVAGTPWFLVTLIDQSRIQGNLRRIAWIVVGTCAGVLLLLGTALLAWWRNKESELRFQALRAETEKELLRHQYDYLSRYANDMIVLADADSRILEVNDKTLKVLGYRREGLTGAPLDVLFPPAGQAQLHGMLAHLRRHGSAFFELEQQRADGSTLPSEISARAIRLEKRQLIQLICRDITERKQAEAALRASEEKLNGILASILDVVWSFSPDLSHLHYINPASQNLYGHPAADFLAHPRLWFDMMYPEDRNATEQALRGLEPASPSCDMEHRIVRGDGTMRWLHSRARLVVGADGRALRIDGVTTDITQRKAAVQQVQTLAYYDSVTALPNRALLNDRLAQAVHMAMRSRKKVALLFMDLDNFKNVNDSLGHPVGDMLLRAVAQCLLQCVREEDTVGRVGGDEFLVVLPDIERGEQAVSVAEKILAATAQPFTLQGQQIHTTISVGISVFPDDGKEPDELIRHADSALYQAKSRGRDNYQFFTQDLNRQIVRASTIERQLRHALDAGELCLWYQPQIDMQRGTLVGAEALLRWRRGGRHFLSPEEFIPVAEERGLIDKIGKWVLHEACRQCRQWQVEGLQPIRIAVNVSPLQFQQKGFATLVARILADTQLDARYLELEITESSIMRRAALVADLATVLRNAGVGISIDDFGTGYSSLSYLKQIPIDKIKIDRSFIADMLSDSDDDAITAAIVSLARSLKLGVIAEGVESGAQLERLRMLGCNEVQGNYYSAAVSAAAFSRFLSGQSLFAHALT